MLNPAQESNGGPAGVGVHAGTISSALSGEESGLGRNYDRVVLPSALEDAAASGACSNVARGRAGADVLEAILAAIADLDAAEFEVARARLVALAASIEAAGHDWDQGGV